MMRNAILLVCASAFAFTACSEKQGAAAAAAAAADAEHEIGVYKLAPGSKRTLTHKFSQRQWICIASDVSWEEGERLDKVIGPDGFFTVSAIQLLRPSDGDGVGSHHGAGCIMEPEPSGESTFELFNNSREALTIRVFWKVAPPKVDP